jgi:hypothetical protein
MLARKFSVISRKAIPNGQADQTSSADHRERQLRQTRDSENDIDAEEEGEHAATTRQHIQQELVRIRGPRNTRAPQVANRAAATDSARIISPKMKRGSGESRRARGRQHSDPRRTEIPGRVRAPRSG